MSWTSSQEEALFAGALAQPPAQRRAFLAQACGADSSLHARLTALLAAHEGPGNLMDSPALARLALEPEEEPGSWVGHYKLLHKIGDGGSSVVWMAESEEPASRHVALKVVRPKLDLKAAVARLATEQTALATVDHPGLAKVLAVGATKTGRLYFATELIRGTPITKHCDRCQLTTAQRLEVFIAACGAIQRAHTAGIIHRDLKPTNLLIVVHNGQAMPKILDFGMGAATQICPRRTRAGTVVEPPSHPPIHLSPEQLDAAGGEADARSDIYSLGVLLYELLTGRAPLDAKAFAQVEIEEMRRRIRETHPPKPSRCLQALDKLERASVARLRGTTPAHLTRLLRRDLDWIVMRCLERERARRYQSVDELVLDLRRHLRHEPVDARPASQAYLFQQWVRRRGTGIAAKVADLGVGVSGAFARKWRGVRAAKARPGGTKRPTRPGASSARH